MARLLTLPVVLAMLVFTVPAASPPANAVPRPARQAVGLELVPSARWAWPVHPVRIVAPYVAPAHRYGPGHRGIDLAASDRAEVRAPADGVIAFSGDIAGRGVVTIDHDGGLVTTLEPVAGEPAVGERVEKGQRIGAASVGGHASPGTIHFGVRLGGDYINPLLLLGELPRAVLLPCCD